ncbi:unnamed protein product [Brachionus calyciflorus]|uniref:Ubiquitin-like protease family profile domain-containing protein n=1 Tax=Brachionus calyciflorus TaxID=104777 RepID=A0A813W7T8_9BILA|nr:unnamed protein product [Brachionus calyciflorus]
MSDLNLNLNDQILSLSISHDLKNLLISLFVNLNDLNGRLLTNENKIKELNSTVFNDHRKRTITQSAKSIYDHRVNILKLSKDFNIKASILNIVNHESHEVNRRKKNLIILNLAETNNDDIVHVYKIFDLLKISKPVSIRKLIKRDQNSKNYPPILCELESPIILKPDLTFTERIARSSRSIQTSAKPGSSCIKQTQLTNSKPADPLPKVDVQTTETINQLSRLKQDKTPAEQNVKTPSIQTSAKPGPSCIKQTFETIISLDETIIIDQNSSSDGFFEESVTSLPTSNFGIKLEKKDLLTLNNNKKLNDKVVKYFLKLLCSKSRHKCLAIDSLYIEKINLNDINILKKWCSKISNRNSSFDYLFFPIHIKDLDHWSLIVFDTIKKEINHLDS